MFVRGALVAFSPGGQGSILLDAPPGVANLYVILICTRDRLTHAEIKTIRLILPAQAGAIALCVQRARGSIKVLLKFAPQINWQAGEAGLIWLFRKNPTEDLRRKSAVGVPVELTVTNVELVMPLAANAQGGKANERGLAHSGCSRTLTFSRHITIVRVGGVNSSRSRLQGECRRTQQSVRPVDI